MENLKKKKVLFVSHILDTSGAPNSLLALLKEITKEDVDLDIKVFSMCDGDLLPMFREIVPTFSVKCLENGNFLVKIINKIYGFFYFLIFLMMNKPNYVLINSAANFRALLICRLFNINTTLYVRELDEMFNSLKWLRKLGIKFANKIIAVSSANKEWLLNQGIDENKICIIGNGINVSEIKQKLKENPEEEFVQYCSNHKVIATIGKIDDYRKGFDMFIEIARRLKDKGNYRFVLIGDFKNNEIRNKYMSLIKELGLEDYFYITGYTNNIFKYLKKVNHVIIPSRSESFSRAILEPLSINISVSCFDIGGNRDIVGEDYPYIVEPYNIDQIVENILNLECLDRKINFDSLKCKFDMSSISKKILEELLR